ncbi:MAG: hypothetical protein [Microviridae sp.]|nr:MAG: hypothetical protein [Microviridae sp.]
MNDNDLMVKLTALIKSFKHHAFRALAHYPQLSQFPDDTECLQRARTHLLCALNALNEILKFDMTPDCDHQTELFDNDVIIKNNNNE